MNKSTSKREKAQEGRELENRCWEYLKPALEEIHRKVDRRLVKTLLDLVIVILMHRNRNNGLLLSELGDQLLGGARGPAGVKRIASLLHSGKWKRADEKVKELRESPEAIYAIWDESVLEKSESLRAERLCAVRSTKAARLKRIKPAGGTRWTKAGRLEDFPGSTFLESPPGLGCTQTLSTKNRCHCVPGSCTGRSASTLPGCLSSRLWTPTLVPPHD